MEATETKIKLKVKGIAYGRIETIKVDVVIPETFKEIDNYERLCKLFGSERVKQLRDADPLFGVNTVDQQIIKYIDDSPTIIRDIMNTHDISPVLDYSIFKLKKKGTKEKKVLDLADELLSSLNGNDVEQLKTDFIAVYATLKPQIKTLSVAKQVGLVMSAMGIGYQSTIVSINKVFDKPEKDDNSNSKFKLIK